MLCFKELSGLIIVTKIGKIDNKDNKDNKDRH
jgi:hypothetical protein